jgi:RNA recognition motif-containing protein
MSRRVYVGNLNFEMTDALLRETFAKVGGVENAEVIKDRWTGISRGFGFVEMMTAEDAEAAISEMDGSEVMGGYCGLHTRSFEEPSRRLIAPAGNRLVEGYETYPSNSS